MEEGLSEPAVERSLEERGWPPWRKKKRNTAVPSARELQSRARLAASSRGSGAVLSVSTVILLLIVGYPLLWIFLGALGVPARFGVERVFEALDSSENLQPVANTLILAAGAGILSVLIGAPLAWAVAHTDMKMRATIRALVALAYIVPPYLTSIAYIILLGPNSGYLNRALMWAFNLRQGPFDVVSMGGVIFVIGMHAFAFPFFLTEMALRSLDARFEEAAQVLGARRRIITVRITLPLVAPAITGGALLAAVDSMALFGPQAFLGLPAQLVFLPTRIYGVLGSYPPRFADASVLSLILVLFTVLGLYLQHAWLERHSYVTVSGRGVRSGRVTLGWLRPWLLAFCLSVGLLAVVAPLAVLVVASFSVVWTSPPAPGNLTLAHYATALFNNQVSIRGILNSFKLAVMAGAIASVLGLAIAYIDLRTLVRGRRFLDYLAVLPLGLPGTVMAVGVLQAFIRPPIRLYGTIWILLVAYVARFIPLSVRTSDASLRQIDPGLEEAARITGASWFENLRRVVLPMARPGLVTAFMLVFIPALNELSATILLYSSGNETISVAIYRLNDLGQLEVVAALAVFSIAVILLVSLLLNHFVGGSSSIANDA